MVFFRLASCSLSCYESVQLHLFVMNTCRRSMCCYCREGYDISVDYQFFFKIAYCCDLFIDLFIVGSERSVVTRLQCTTTSSMLDPSPSVRWFSSAIFDSTCTAIHLFCIFLKARRYSKHFIEHLVTPFFVCRLALFPRYSLRPVWMVPWGWRAGSCCWLVVQRRFFPGPGRRTDLVSVHIGIVWPFGDLCSVF